ncbi:3349_t:CDS:2 [Ambispora gerdemannii]|uniref:3349_t:CDS:1 n=1 Tax=Ambispora gerdemannii TaxID=144530 RepID=A0A9N9F5U8_9GLOM|nr:3349_t:CDS:2 [Ambispora gerdemannii]
MFIGHYGFALIVKVWEPKIPLTFLGFASQLLDWIWAILVTLQIEKVKYEIGYTKTNNLHCYSMPYSHSLLAAIIWSITLAIWHRLFSGGRNKEAALVGLVVFSHWIEDFICHKEARK